MFVARTLPVMNARKCGPAGNAMNHGNGTKCTLIKCAVSCAGTTARDTIILAKKTGGCVSTYDAADQKAKD